MWGSSSPSGPTFSRAPLGRRASSRTRASLAERRWAQARPAKAATGPQSSQLEVRRASSGGSCVGMTRRMATEPPSSRSAQTWRDWLVARQDRSEVSVSSGSPGALPDPVRGSTSSWQPPHLIRPWAS